MYVILHLCFRMLHDVELELWLVMIRGEQLAVGDERRAMRLQTTLLYKNLAELAALWTFLRTQGLDIYEHPSTQWSRHVRPVHGPVRRAAAAGGPRAAGGKPW